MSTHQLSHPRISLGIRLGLCAGVFSLLLAFTISVLVGMQSARSLRESQRQVLEDAAFQMADKLERGLYERLADIRMLTKIEANRGMLENLQESIPEFAWIGRIDPQGKVISATRGMLEGADVTKRPWFGEGLKGFYIGDLHEAVLLQKLLSDRNPEPMRFVDVTGPIKDANGKVIGVIGGHLSWSWAKSVRDSVVQKMETQRGVELYVLSSSGQVLLGPSGRAFEKINPAADPDFVVGQAQVGVQALVKNLGWSIVVRQSEAIALKPSHELQQRILVVGGCLGLLFALVGGFLGNRFGTPFTLLAESARRVKEGRDPEFPAFKPGDEAGDLTQAMRDLFVSVERKRLQLQTFNANLQATVDERTKELQVAYERLSTSESKMRSIMETALDAIIATNQEGIIIAWNEGSTSTFGYNAEEVIGKSIAIIFPARFREAHVQSLLKVSQTGSSKLLGRRTELIGLRKDASEFDLDLSLSCWKGEDAQLYFTAVLRDITELKRTEKALISARELAESAADAKSRFLAQMSHEIRTPLNGVIGMSQILLDTPLSAEQRDYAQTVLDSSEGLLNIINDVLDFSKVDAGKMELEVVSFDPRHLLADTVKSFSVMASKKGIQLNSRFSGTGPERLMGDAGRIRQVLTNLIGNALKFTENGSVNVMVTASQGRSGFMDLAFEIEDTGIGISEAAVSRLFEAFTQADNSMSRRFGGSGLGLSICKKLVDLMQGTIGVQTRENQGSKFWFKITLEISQERVVENENANAAEAPNAPWPARILIAEDNPVNLRIALMMLTKAGYRPQGVGNGKEVLDALHTAHYDLILMDCQMPEMDGFEATRAIRGTGALKSREIPIIALTANAVKGAETECLDAGMNDFISKPVRLHDLMRVIEKNLPRTGEPQAS